ncbi:neuropeptides capa receptor-like [Antedon mediterranea]|uniref:neuropeptides capa receptor-like n=1 Tax=Antedon mediterranea TaxID=105859 RepID=UPI003AF9B7AB
MKNSSDAPEATNWDGEIEPYLYTDLEVYSLYIFLPIVVFIGIVGNASTIIVLSTNVRMRNSLNIYLVNLAISDLIFLIIASTFMWVNIIKSDLHLYHDNSWCSVEYCKFNTFLVDSVYQLSATLTFAISAERFVAITQPLKYRAYVSKKRTMKICCAIWVIILLWQSRNLVTNGKMPLEFPWPDMTNGIPNSTDVCVFCMDFKDAVCEMMEYALLADVFLSLLYLVLMIPMYGKVFWSLRAPFKKAEKDTSSASNRVNYEMKALQTVIITVSVYVMFTAPLNMLWVLFYFDAADPNFTTLFANIFRFLGFVNAAINPIIYNVSNKAYRQALFEFIGISSAKKLKSSSKYSQSTSLQTVSSNISQS